MADPELEAEIRAWGRDVAQEVADRSELINRLKGINDAPPTSPTAHQLGIYRSVAFRRARAIADWNPAAAAGVHPVREWVPGRCTPVGMG